MLVRVAAEQMVTQEMTTPRHCTFGCSWHAQRVGARAIMLPDLIYQILKSMLHCRTQRGF